jgi:argininosuccinate lyase
MSDAAGQRKMWGGRFERGPDASFYEFERSWKFDRRLLPQEFALDRAWARAIARAGILTNEEGEQLVAALDALETRAKSDSAWLDNSKAEDVHHFVETALIEKLGALGAKLHTGRSRNDMVATEFRMYVKDAAHEIQRAIASLEHAIATQAERNLKVSMPGNTHMQHAQPLLLRAPMFAHSVRALFPAAHFRSIAKRLLRISAFQPFPPTAWTLLATATSRSNIFLRLQLSRCTCHGSPRILSCSLRRSSGLSSCRMNFPPAAA